MGQDFALEQVGEDIEVSKKESLENGILKISSLKKFGIFNNFIWENLVNFGKNNLIYGWNYSGKTTLSKLFQILEFESEEIHTSDPIFQNVKFELGCKNKNKDNIISANNIANFPFKVKVFNSEYISRIFTFNKPEAKIHGISFFLGDEANEISNKIEELKYSNNGLGEKIKVLEWGKIALFEEYEIRKFTKEAKKIREEYLPNMFQAYKFNKGHFKEIVEEIINDFNSYILEQAKKNEVRESALLKNEYNVLPLSLNFCENLEAISLEVKNILEDTAPTSVDIPELNNNVELSNWVQNGLRFHENSSECKFCTNALPESRILNLNSYYSQKFQNIQEAMKKILEEIQNEEQKIKLTLPHEKEIIKNYQAEYKRKVEEYKDATTKYEKQLKTLRNDLIRKNEHIFDKIEATKFEIMSITKEANAIEEILKKHNNHIKNFEAEKERAINAMKRHYVADYLKSEKYIDKKKLHDDAKKEKKEMEKQIENNKSEIISLDAKLKNIDIGKDKLNKNLQILLHRKDVKIEIESDGFVLKRSKGPAYNLSEGEKSAIAFSYFITELESLKASGELINYIIFIDDPISSMDSNHIFQVRSIIKSFFNNSNYCQLFVSTHNFEFLSILIDSKLFGRIETETKQEKKKLYFIQRSESRGAEIINMPKPFSSCKSEYAALYSVLQKYNTSEDKENFDNILVLPNVLRRFLELYTLMKYPSTKEIDARLDKVFSDNDGKPTTVKLMHWFSHLNQLDKVQRHDDKIFQIKDAIEELFEHIKENDKTHWEGLQDSTED